MVNPLPVCSLFTGPWTNQDAKNREAAEHWNNQGENQEAEDHSQGDVFKSKNASSSKGKQPNTPNADISDSDPSPFSQAQVDDGMYSGQVALHTGQVVKEHLSKPNEGPKMECHHYYIAISPMYTPTAKGVSYDTKKLHGDQVVGEAVWVTRHRCCGGGALLPPSLETQVEDEDAEREEEEDACDAEREVD